MASKSFTAPEIVVTPSKKLQFPGNLGTMPRCIGIEIRERILNTQPSMEVTPTGVTDPVKGIPTAAMEAGKSFLKTGSDLVNSIADVEFTENTKAFLYLPLPNNIATDHSADWSGRGLSPLEYAMRKAGEYGGDWGVFGQAYGQRMALSGASLLAKKAAGKTGTSVSTVDAAGSAVLAGAKITMNPYHQLMYSGPSFRTFSFEWVLSPSNAKEARDIEAIIWMLKKYMHTSSTTQQMFFTFPAYASIKFLEKRSNNTSHLFNIKDCAITRVNTQYERKFHADGHPIAIRLSVDFLESVVLTQSDFPNSDFNKIYDGLTAEQYAARTAGDAFKLSNGPY